MLKLVKDIISESKVLDKMPEPNPAIPYIEEISDNSVIYHIGDTEYQADNITQTSYGIRAVIEMRHKGDLVNKNLVSLYSSRARVEFINKLKGFDPKKTERQLLCLESELKKFLERTIKHKLIKENKKAPEITEEDKKAAMEFLTSPDMFSIIEKDITALGYVGENTNKILTYLIATSRKLDNPLSGVVKAQSSSGKSQLLKSIVSLMPPEEIVDVSRITDNALFWLNTNDLKHKLITIAEREGSDGANYSIRLLQSEKKLRLLAPQKGECDVLKTQWLEVNGPVAFLETTTGTVVEIDNHTRVFEIYIDESEEQTKLIQNAQKQARTLEGMFLKKYADAIIKKHQNAQRLLEPLKVVVPFAPLVEFPTRWVRTRRDMDRFLDLITAISFLRQFQKTVSEDGLIGRFVEANADDYETAYKLAVDVLGQNLDELDKRSRELLGQIVEMVNEMSERNDGTDEITFTRRDIIDYLKKNGVQIYPQILQNYITPLEESEFIELLSGGRGKKSVYKLNLTTDDNGRITIPSIIKGLTSPDELRAKISKLTKPAI
ncbi:MAG: hypothetical protein ABII27_00085 [bacterium]